MKKQILSQARLVCIFSAILAFNTSCKEGPDSVASPEIGASRVSAEIETLAAIPESKLNNDLTIRSEYEVRNGVLYFKNAKTFSAFEDKLNQMLPEDRLKFTRSIRFISAADAIHEAAQLLEKSTSKEEFNSTLATYQDVIQINEGYVEPKVNRALAYLTNRKGMVSIGGYIHAFTRGGQMIFGSDISEAEQYLKNPIKSDIKVAVFGNVGDSKLANARLAGSCSSIDRTAQNGDGNRRVRIQTSIGVEYFCLYGDCQYGNAEYQVQQYAYTLGTPTKKNFWGNFVTYRTGNTLSTRYSLDFSSVATGNTTRTVTADYTYSNDWDSIDYKQIVAAARFYGSANGPQYTTWTNTFYDGVPTGYYTSGGVPSGVPQSCQ